MVSRLCYHCGVSVKMNYQNPGHTSGSGAHSEDVPKGFKVTATSVDGIIEGVERVGKLPGYVDGGGVIIGVQFHPEVITNAGNPEFLPIFRFIVEEAGK